MQKAAIKVHFGPDTPSKIVLPVFPPTPADGKLPAAKS